MTRFRRFVLLFSLLSAVALRGQTHSEVGDAGQLPASVQVPSGSGALTSIQGGFVLSGSGFNTLDVDLYLIQIDNPATFTATAVMTSGFIEDPQLFLFDTNGRGVTHCNNAVGVNPTLTGTFVERPGQYLLAVCLDYIDAAAKGVGCL